MTALPEPLVEAIAASVMEDFPAVTEDFAAALVRLVVIKIDAAREVDAGDPVGTVRGQDGSVARRILREGIPMWEVMPVGGVVEYDQRPTLTWPIIFSPAPAIEQ